MNLEPMLLWLIDDENVNDDLIEEFCELRHIRFCTFRTPHQAHARLADPSQPQPDIVLLDYEFRNVPGTDRWPSGLAYLPELRRVLRTDAVVMLFTQHFSADYQLVAEAIRLGADGVLHKESDHGELEAAYRLASARVVSTPESIRKDALELHRRIQADDDCKHVLSREVRDAQPQDRVVFLITPFPTEGDDESLSTTLEHVSRKLERRGYVGIRSNRFMPNKARLWEWVAAVTILPR